MIAEIKHGLQELRNTILAFIIVVPLQLLVLTEINSTILLQNVIALSFLFIVIILVFVYTIVKRDSNNKVVILFFLLVILFLLLFIRFLLLYSVLDINFNTMFLNQLEIVAIHFIKLFGIESAFYLIISFRGYLYINKIAMCKNIENSGSEDNKYSAVLIGNNLSKMKDIDTFVGSCGLYWLIKYFKNTDKHYVICKKVGKSHFDEFVLNDDCQELYILGHGSKNSFKIKNKTTNIDYLEYKGKAKHQKKVVAQLHCAGSKIGDESLVDILAPDTENSYVGCGYISFLNIWFYCFNMWRKNRPKRCNDNI